MSDMLWQRYIQLFLTDDGLKHMLVYMCNACTMEISDPVTYTILMFINTPVSFSVTQIGLMPFKDIGTAIFPYNKMTNEQKLFIIEYLDYLEQNAMGNVSTQMGGGCIVSMNSSKYPCTYLEQTDVIVCFCKTVMEHPNYSSEQSKLNICNIVIQQVGVRVALSKNVLQRVNERVRAFKTISV
jgi:hypothetical protein